MEMQHAAPMGLSFGLQTLWEYRMRRPAYLSWTPSHSLRNYIGEGCQSHPLALLLQPFGMRMRRPSVLPVVDTVTFSPEFHWRGGANPTPSRSPSIRSKRARRSTCTPASACAIRVHAGAAQCQCCSCHLAHRSEAVRIPPPRAPPPAVRNSRRRQLRRFSRASPIAGASGSPTAKLELRDGTRAFRALQAPAAAQQRNSNPSRQQEPDGELRTRSDGRCVASAGAAPLLAPAAAQRRNSTPATTLEPSAHC